MDFLPKTIQYDEHTLIKLQFWDIMGQTAVNALTRKYFSEAQGAFVVCGAMDRVRHTLEADVIQKWKKVLEENVAWDGELVEIPTILLVNQIDVLPKQHDEFTAEMKRIGATLGFDEVIETSAQDNTNIDSAVNLLVRRIIQEFDALDNVEEPPRSDTSKSVVVLGKNTSSDDDDDDKKAPCCF